MNPTQHPTGAAPASAPRPVFSRILVGVDGTEPGFEACRQARRFAEPDAWLEAVSVVHLADAIWTGGDAPRVADELQRDAEEALDKAIAILGDTTRRKFINGYIATALLDEIRQIDPTVLAIGSHGHHRMTEIVFGGVAGELIHSAPCSVLVTRAPTDRAAFPSSIVVGVDGSKESETALAAAGALADRIATPLRCVVGLHGKDIDSDQVRLLAPRAEFVEASPVDALNGAAHSNDLLVVGNRGLHGLHALGSVSERIAHRATCSVLVVRHRRGL